MSPRRLCVFPADPLHLLLQKGEIKVRYWNPCDLFDEVHVITQACDRHVTPEMVQRAAGRAKVTLHHVGTYNYFARPGTWRRLIGEAAERVRGVGPELVRGWGPHFKGYLAVRVARRLGLPSVVSLHAHTDLDRVLLRRRRAWREWAILQATRFTIEPWTLRHADRVVCAYRFPVEYARRHGAADEKIRVIYNRVYLDAFRPREGPRPPGPLRVLCVGRQYPDKSPAVLIRAMVGVEASLTLIGDGEEHDALVALSRSLGVRDRVRFIRAVPHAELPQYYREADVFALPIRVGGVAIPVLEAIASGLPVVVPEPRFESEPEVVGDVAVVVPNNPEGFRIALRRLQEDPALRATLGARGRRRALEIDGRRMEEAERDLYLELMGKQPGATPANPEHRQAAARTMTSGGEPRGPLMIPARRAWRWGPGRTQPRQTPPATTTT